METFKEYEFKAKVQKALATVQRVLDINKNPRIAEDVNHQYPDKYVLAQATTGSSIRSAVQILQQLGLTDEQLGTMMTWVHKDSKSASVQISGLSECSFIEERTREVEGPKVTTKTEGGIFGDSKTTRSTITTVTEYFFKYKFSWRLVATRSTGDTEADNLLVASRTCGEVELISSTKTLPYAEKILHSPLTVNVTWLLQKLDPANPTESAKFSIDRSKSSCHTPRRNDDISDAMSFFARFKTWGEQVNKFLEGWTFNPLTSASVPGLRNKYDLNMISGSNLFVPIVPLFEDGEKSSRDGADEELKVAGASGDLNRFFAVDFTSYSKFLDEASKQLKDKAAEVNAVFPAAASNSLFSAQEAVVLCLSRYLGMCVDMYLQTVNYIEHMLRQQLISAIGKEVGPKEFQEYMDFHNRKIFKPQYGPRPFCFSIRRSEVHSPEGSLQLEFTDTDGTSQPMNTIAYSSPAGVQQQEMQFALSAETKCTFRGRRFVHAMLLQKFSSQRSVKVKLLAQTRQFSSFVLMLGKIASATEFQPTHALILKNKDMLSLPLDLEELPTPKAFKDAIQSLSPEQQRFAKAFRSMQLASTLFGVAVVQIKPQLEKLLNLKPDSLTKEIRLTQNLMDLFIELQIPPDMLSFDGDDNASEAARLQAVKAHVQAMKTMVSGQEDDDFIKAAKRKMQEALEAPSPPRAPQQRQQQQQQYEAPRTLQYLSGKMTTLGGGGDFPSAPSEASFGGPTLRSLGAGRTGPPSLSFGGAKTAAPLQQLVQGASSSSSSSSSSSVSASPSAPSPEQAQGRLFSSFAPNAGTSSSSGGASDGTVVEFIDYTSIPTALEEKYDQLDVDAALRPTIIKLSSDSWEKKSQEALLSARKTTYIGATEKDEGKTAAFDLLDALSRSGGLVFEDVDFHVIIAGTHCFDKSLMDTLVKDNMNPIEKVERSALIMASCIHRTAPKDMLQAEHVKAVAQFSPMLFPQIGHASKEAKDEEE